MKPAVLFVCLGNICRSPLAEAAFRTEAARLGVNAEADSAGTGAWHVGEAPDPRAQAVAKRHGSDISAYKARQVTMRDFHRFTHIIALDSSNLTSLRRMRPANAVAEISLLLDHVAGREGEAVADPYYGAEDAFEITWAEVSEGTQGLVRLLMARTPSL
jgi:protein-tyrosine phosphatase